MTTLQAIVLGLLQGLTEFLPVSSTAHLRVFPALLGWDDPGAAFTAVTQLGTLAAVLVYFRRDLWQLLSGSVRALRTPEPLQSRELRLVLGIGFGTVPIAVCGLAFKHAIENNLRSLWVVATTLVLLALLLALAEKLARHERGMEGVTFRDGILMGAAQALALVPGVSRSGVTLTAGLSCGLRRDAAARFSFLLGIPAVFAAAVLEMKQVVKAGALHAGPHEPGFAGAAGAFLGDPTFIATVVAFVSGMATIALLLGFLRRRSTLVFIVYRVVLGGLVFVMLAGGLLKP